MPERGGSASPSRSTDAEGSERLQKVLARAGIASRRAARSSSTPARTVNGAIAMLGRRVDVATDVVELDGAPSRSARASCTTSSTSRRGRQHGIDPEGRRTVVELVPEEPRVFPVGRLDIDTEGLLV